MTKKRFWQTISKFLLGTGLTAGLIFGCAGTLAYPGGWLLMGVLFLPMFLAGIVLMVKNPALLEKRLHAKESQMKQQTVIKLSGLMFSAGFSLAGLDFRFGWTRLPGGVQLMGAGLLLLAYGLYGEVVRENTFLSRTVEVQKNQHVVDTGLYAIVRHPMYSATLILFLSIPVVLGSGTAILPFLGYPVLIAMRIRNEEQVLEQGLEGYREYKTRVRWRLIPYIW